MKSYLWYFRLPGMFPAHDVRFEARFTESQARAYMRYHLGLKRLPNGTEFWPGDQEGM